MFGMHQLPRPSHNAPIAWHQFYELGAVLVLANSD